MSSEVVVEDWVDDDGYPTEEALEWIKTYDVVEKGYKEVFDKIFELWAIYEPYYAGYDHNILGKMFDVWELSTAGWSGNESIVAAMEQNWLLWAMTWYSSKRGGHYVFHIPVDSHAKA